MRAEAVRRPRDRRAPRHASIAAAVRGGWRPAVPLAALALAAARPASADVIEVGADGAVAVRSGAGAVLWTGGADAPADMEMPAGAIPSGRSRAPAAYAADVARIAARHAISPALLEAVAWRESGWRPAAVSPAGAIGLTQLMPATARALGVDPRDPRANLEGGARVLRRMLDAFDGDIERALAAYNAGPARVLRANGVPNIAETRGYVAAVLDRVAFPDGD